MSINVTIVNHLPVLAQNEYYVLRRENCDFDFTVQTGKKYSSSGSVVLTTNRIVGICSYGSKLFSSFDIGLNYVSSHRIDSTFWGTKYLRIEFRKVFPNINGYHKVKIYFMKGAPGKFLSVFKILMENLQQNRWMYLDGNTVGSILNGNLERSLKEKDDYVRFIPNILNSFNSLSYGNYCNQFISLKNVENDFVKVDKSILNPGFSNYNRQGTSFQGSQMNLQSQYPMDNRQIGQNSQISQMGQLGHIGHNSMYVNPININKSYSKSNTMIQTNPMPSNSISIGISNNVPQGNYSQPQPRKESTVKPQNLPKPDSLSGTKDIENVNYPRLEDLRDEDEDNHPPGEGLYSNIRP